ncbi:MAG TPA: response regulator [Thermoanaerobaculia bacterium]|nr:response regulator [Thermoanaerobaculia bacterium]
MKSILIVEDDAGLRQALEELLNAAGIPHETAADGCEALEKLMQGPTPGAVVLDLMMPVMDGFRFLSARKLDRRIAAIPVIVLTAVPEVLVDRADLNVHEIIAKPCDPERLVETVRRYAEPVSH